MKIIKTDKMTGKKEQVTLESCIDDTEGASFWKKGTVKEMLENGIDVFTSWAVFHKEKI